MRAHFASNSMSQSFVNGAFSGIVSNLSVYPLEVARTRMAMTGEMGTLTLKQIIMRTIEKEGKLGMYKGATISAFGVVIYKGVGFTAYELLRTLNQSTLAENLNFLHFSSGAVGAFIGQISIELFNKALIQ